VSDWITAGLLLVGTVFILLAAIGLLRMPDVFMRMHAATKMPTLAMGCILLAAAVYFGEPAVLTRALLGIAFFFLTVPVAAHMIGRVAHLTHVPLWSGSVMDELRAHRQAGDGGAPMPPVGEESLRPGNDR
jgi:multicomponent Na+:H+ antiporter subunit G